MIDVDELPDLKYNMEHGKLKKLTTQDELKHRVESVEGEVVNTQGQMPIMKREMVSRFNGS